MRIGFDAKRAFFNRTGLGNYSRNLLAALGKHHSDNQYVLYAPKAPGNPPLFDLGQGNFEVSTPQGIWSGLPKALWRTYGLGSRLKKQHIELYHGLSNELPLGVPNNIKRVVTIHDLIFLRFPEWYNAIDRRIYEAKSYRAAKTADAIIAISKRTKIDIVKYYKVNPKRVHTIYQSCHPGFYRQWNTDEKEALRKKYNLPDNYILYVGSLTPRKSAITLVQAFKRLKNSFDIDLVLVGDGGKYKKQIEQYIEMRELHERVHIIPYVPQEDLPGIYQNAQVFVYPSIYEGFGIPIIEALYSKVPVITSNVGCFPEAGGPDSMYVYPRSISAIEEGLRQILLDESLQQQMAEKGYEYVQRFNEDVIAGQVMELYRSVLDG